MNPFQEYAQEIRNYGASGSSIKGFAMTAQTFAKRHPEMLNPISVKQIPEQRHDIEGVVIQEGTVQTFGRPLVIDDSVPEDEVKLLTDRDMEEYQIMEVVE